MPADRSPRNARPVGPKPGTAAYNDMVRKAKTAREEELDRNHVSINLS